MRNKMHMQMEIENYNHKLKNKISKEIKKSKLVTSQYSEGSLFRRYIIPKVHQSEN